MWHSWRIVLYRDSGHSNINADTYCLWLFFRGQERSESHDFSPCYISTSMQFPPEVWIIVHDEAFHSRYSVFYILVVGICCLLFVWDSGLLTPHSSMDIIWVVGVTFTTIPPTHSAMTKGWSDPMHIGHSHFGGFVIVQSSNSASCSLQYIIRLGLISGKPHM